MGWAPLILFSGLCLTIIRPWQFFLWFFGDYIQQLLLDKAPFNFVSLTIGNTLTTTDFSKLWFLKGDSFRFDWRTRDTRTPTSVPSPSCVPPSIVSTGVDSFPTSSDIFHQHTVE